MSGQRDVFLVGENALYSLDTVGFRVSKGHSLAQCEDKVGPFEAPILNPDILACSNTGNCYISDIYGQLFRRSARRNGWCFKERLLGHLDGPVTLKQLITWRDRLVPLDRGGDLWIRNFKASAWIQLHSAKALRLFSIRDTLFAVSDIGVFRFEGE